MQGKKTLLAKILYHSRLLHLFNRFNFTNKLIILNYHRIRPDSHDFATAFDEGVFNVTASQFTAELTWLKKNVTLYSEQDLLSAVRSQSPPRDTGVLITFDDAYRDIYTIAYPVLKKLQIPAIFFIPTNIVNTRRLGWWDIIAYLIKKSRRPEIEFQGERFALDNNRPDVIQHFQQKMKHAEYEGTRNLLMDLAAACEVELPRKGMQDEQLLTWEQIKELSRDGFAIGSHAHTHRVLATMDTAAQREEMVLSKFILEQKLGRNILSIAYPVGERQHVSPETPELARQSGYVLGFLHNTRVNRWETLDAMAIKRIGGLLDDVSTVSAMAVLPEIFTWESVAASQKSLLQKTPDYASRHLRLGLTQLGQGRLDEAAQSFEKALEINPHYTQARIKLAITKACRGRLDEAAAELGELADTCPSYPDIHYLLGIINAGRRHFDEAAASLRRSIQLNPLYMDALIKLAILCCHQGNYTAALEALEQALRCHRDNDQYITSAIRSVHAALAAEVPPQTVSGQVRGIFFEDAGLVVEIQNFFKHIEITPSFSDTVTIISKSCAEDHEKLKGLLPLLRDYIDRFPAYADLHYLHAQLYRKLRRPQEAEACLRETLRLNPRYVKARIALFKLLHSLGKNSEALREADRLLASDLPCPDVLYTAAKVLIALSRYDEALDHLRSALKINPHYAEASCLMESIHERDRRALTTT